MAVDIWEACVMSQPDANDDRALFVWADMWAARVSMEAEAVSALLSAIAPEVPDDLLVLFSAVLDSIRMNLENNEREADQIFGLVEAWMETTGAGLETSEKMALCQAFMRANLAPPDAIRLDPGDAEFAAMAMSGEMPDISALLSDLLPDGVRGYPAFMMLNEAMSAMPAQAGEAFVFEMIKQALPQQISLARYFLLSPDQSLGEAAASGFVVLSEDGGVDAALLSDLIQLRKWMPEDAARATLDRAIKIALQREPSGGDAPRAWRQHRLLSSLPDGTGSQSILASVSRGSEKAVATLLIKAGHGIKDAYAIPCKSATDQRELIAEIETGLEMHEIQPEYLEGALAQALGDHLPPAPGFLDVVTMLGLPEIAPEAPCTPSMIADPDGNIAELSAQKRGRLINRNIEFAQNQDITSSWFVSDAALSRALEDARTELQAEKAVWTILETQRTQWAMIFARAAAILRHADEYAWQSFAAVALGLEAGRPLKKIPIFEMMVALTLDVAEGEGYEALQDPLDDMPYSDDDLAIAPEKSGELDRLLKDTPLGPDSVNGYLTAILIAPEFTTPAEWLPPLMNGIRLNGEGSMQRFLDLLMLRFETIRNDIMADEVAASLHKASDAASWLSGFQQAAALKSAWPKKALSKGDRKILGLVGDSFTDAQVQDTVITLLPAWLKIMAQRAFDE